MATNHDIRELLEATAYDVDGEKLGKVSEVYINDASGQPDFIEVNHGLFGLGSSLVPLRGHDLAGDELRLAFRKDLIKDAPNVDAEAHLSNEEQNELYRHYELTNVEDRTVYGQGAAAGAGVAGAGVAADRRDVEAERHVEADRRVETDRAAAANVSNDNEMIRSEERLNVDKQREAAGQVNLRKYVVEETQSVEVPVQREEVTVERTPINAEDAANYDNTIGEENASVTLHEERVNVSKESVPVEKVSLNKQVVEDTETVTDTVRKEQFDTNGTEGTERK